MALNSSQGGSIRILIYAPPDSGKSSLALTAENPLLWDFNNGVHRVVEQSIPTSEIAYGKSLKTINSPDKSFSDSIDKVLDALGQADKIKAYQTMVVDTVSDLTLLVRDRIAKKEGVELSFSAAFQGYKKTTSFRGVNPTLQGFGQLSNLTQLFLRQLLSFERDVIVTAHQKEIEPEDNSGSVRIRPDIQNGILNNIINKDFDLIGYIEIKNGKRILSFDNRPPFMGKNFGFGPYEIPDASDPAFKTFMADLIRAVKSKIASKFSNQASSDQFYRELHSKIQSCETPDDFDLVLGDLQEPTQGLEEVVKRLKRELSARAKSLGITYSKDDNAFVAQAKSNGSNPKS